MRRPLQLRLQALEGRDVPSTVFYWLGDRNSNANDYRNWRDVEGNTVSDVPTTGSRIIINSDSRRTMYIHAENQIDCDSISVLGVKPLADLILDTGDASNGKGHLYVRGVLNIRGGGVPGSQPQSTWGAGILEIDSSNALDPGIVNLIGGELKYTGGEIDTIENNTGLVYVYDSGNLRLNTAAGKIGAKLFIARDHAFAPSPGYLYLDTPGNMTFFRDATVGIAGEGVCNLMKGGLKLFNLGGPPNVGTGIGWFENYGATYVEGDIPSDMYFNNVSGHVFVFPGKKLDIAGWKVLDDGTKASFVNGGMTILGNTATLRLVDRYFNQLGALAMEDSAPNSVFAINGNVDIQGGTLRMGVDMEHHENQFGTLAITGTLRFGPTGRLDIHVAHVSGTEPKCDKVSAESIMLAGSPVLGVRTTGMPGAGAEHEFLTGTVTGEWGGIVCSGDYLNWAIDPNQKKVKR